MPRIKRAAARFKSTASTKKSRGQTIAESQKRNAELRDQITGMTSVQLNNLVARLDAKTIARVKRAAEKAEAQAADKGKERIQKKIDRLQKQLKKL